MKYAPMWASKRNANGQSRPEQAIARTTPTLLGLFSLVTLVAHEHYRHQTNPRALMHGAAWYTKTTPTFTDALALVRRHLWTQTTFPTSLGNSDVEKVPRALLTHLADLLCYAASWIKSS